ncbi:MAG: four helix bundle protein [Vicinamibacterales bacterium]
MAGTAHRPPFDLRQRTFRFACLVLRAYPRDAWGHEPSRVVWRQLLRAATSVGANLEEAQSSASRADFTARMRLVLREAREALYWLRLVEANELAGRERAVVLRQEAHELVAIITAIMKRLDPVAPRRPR